MTIKFIEDLKMEKLKEKFVSDKVIEKIYITAYFENPLKKSYENMVVLRGEGSNVIISDDEQRLILKRKYTFQDCILNILYSKIEKCFFKGEKTYCEFVLKVKDIYYKITIFD